MKINIKNNSDTELSIKDRIEEMTADCIVEVILGLDISSKHEKEITKECKKKGIPLFKAEKIPFKFGISRVRLF